MKVGQNTGVDMERTLTLEYPACFNEGIVLHELLHVLGNYLFILEYNARDRKAFRKKL